MKQDYSPAMVRARQLFFDTKGQDLPKEAARYVSVLSSKVGFCGETCLTALAHYAQLVEGLECTEEGYIAINTDRERYA